MLQQKQIYKAIKDCNRLILIILDACRYDYFEEQTDGNLQKVTSAGSSTHEWFNNTWKDYSPVAYVTANPYINRRGYVCDTESKFDYLNEVWDWGWGEVNGIPTVPAEAVVEAVRKTILKGHTRIIAHFIQPHPPYCGKIPIPVETFIAARERALNGHTNKVDSYRYADCDADLLREAYTANLEYVIERGVKLLLELEESGFKVIVSADHGELLGEYGRFGHPDGLDVPELKEIPWWEP